jgi:hypothetical protein
MRPAPLRTDRSNAFAHYSMSVRVPKILDDVIALNPELPAAARLAVERLRDDIAGNAKLPALRFPAPDAAEWEAAVAAYSRQTWLATDWFFAECYVYRCLMLAVRYWESGLDPFAAAKREELAGQALWRGLDGALDDASDIVEVHLAELMLRALWGNRVDLSYAVGVAFGAAGHSDDLLCDDRARAIPALLRPDGDVHIVADNTGSELSTDLALADTLLARAGARVSLHVKIHPTFVSDAIAGDVWALLAAMGARGGACAELAGRLRRAWDDDRLRILPDPFWNGPRFLWERPSRLARVLDGATAVVLKGDANYRRAIGDAIYPDGFSFAAATDYFPAPLVCLRTMKSDALAGLPPGRSPQLDAVDRDWRINGRRGVIQLGGKGADPSP